jgi:hypothetical protein
MGEYKYDKYGNLIEYFAYTGGMNKEKRIDKFTYDKQRKLGYSNDFF